MNLSCADYAFPLLPRGQALDLIRLLELDAVDIGLFGRSTHFPIRDVTAGREIRRALDGRGLTPADVFVQIGTHPAEFSVNDPDPATREAGRETFLRALEFTTTLDCRHMTGLPGVNHPAISPESALGLAAEATAWRLETAANAGVRYAVEAHHGSICPDPGSAAAFLRHVPGLTLTLDYGHFLCVGCSNEQVHPLLPYASHMHMRCAAPGLLQCAAPANRVDFEAIAALLREQRFQGFLCLEYVWIEWMGCNQVDNVSETVLLRDRLRALLRAPAREPEGETAP